METQNLTRGASPDEAQIDEIPAPPSKRANKIRKSLSLSDSEKYRIKEKNIISPIISTHKRHPNLMNKIMPYNDRLEQETHQEVTIFTEDPDIYYAENSGKNIVDIARIRNINEKNDQLLARRFNKAHWKQCKICKKFAYFKNNVCINCKKQPDMEADSRKADRCLILFTSFCCCLLNIGN